MFSQSNETESLIFEKFLSLNEDVYSSAKYKVQQIYFPHFKLSPVGQKGTYTSVNSCPI